MKHRFRAAALTVAPLLVAAGIVAVTIGPGAPQIGRALQGAVLHPPDWALWEGLSLQVKAHILAALVALAVGLVILLLPKGRGWHKPLGWLWVGAMAATALSSIFIRELNAGSFSLIHVFTGWTLVALPLALLAIRNRNIGAHRRAMLGMYFGGVLVAGALTFLPGRFLFEFFFG